MSNTTDIELGNIDADKAIAVEIKHDDKLKEDDIAFFQVSQKYPYIVLVYCPIWVCFRRTNQISKHCHMTIC